MAFLDGDALTALQSSQSLADAGHAERHNEKKAALEEIRTRLGEGAGGVAFDDSGLVVVSGSTTVQAALAALDARTVRTPDATALGGAAGDLVSVDGTGGFDLVASGTYAQPGQVAGFAGSTSTQYIAPAGIMETGGSFNPANESIYAVPLFLPSSLTLDRIGVKVNTAGESGSVVRLGIYNSDSAGKPSSLLVDGGTVAGDSTGAKEVTISEAVDAGLYWLTAVCQSASTTRPQLASFRPIGFPFTYNNLANAFAEAIYSQTGVSGALNASFGTTFYNAKGPAVVVRVA